MIRRSQNRRGAILQKPARRRHAMQATFLSGSHKQGHACAAGCLNPPSFWSQRPPASEPGLPAAPPPGPWPSPTDVWHAVVQWASASAGIDGLDGVLAGAAYFDELKAKLHIHAPWAMVNELQVYLCRSQPAAHWCAPCLTSARLSRASYSCLLAASSSHFAASWRCSSATCSSSSVPALRSAWLPVAVLGSAASASFPEPAPTPACRCRLPSPLQVHASSAKTGQSDHGFSFHMEAASSMSMYSVPSCLACVDTQNSNSMQLDGQDCTWAWALQQLQVQAVAGAVACLSCSCTVRMMLQP